MSQKIILSIMFVLTLIIITAVIIFTINKQPIISPISNIKTKDFSLIKFKEFIDPSGYKFQYPEELSVATKEATNNNVYSALDLSSSKKGGDLSITITSSDLKIIDSWLKTNNITTDSAKIKKLNLADLEAYQFSTGSKIQTVALDQGALISIIVDPKEDKDFWLNTNQKFISSFTFIAPPADNSQENTSPSENTDDVVFEGEEVVE